MHALILAAGRGSRLGDAAATPKCLVEVGGRPLLLHQVDALRNAGATRVTVVVGHAHERVREVDGGVATFVLNARYAETNSLYSFWLARRAVRGDLFVVNCDVLFPAQILHALVSRGGSALAFDSGSGEDDEHMKVRLREGRLVRMSKQLPSAEAQGENVGVIRLTEAAANAAFCAAGSLVRSGRDREWVGSAVNAIAHRHPISCIDIAGAPWVEIDFPHDLALARTQVWPAIESLMVGARPIRHGWAPGSVGAAA
ncbi:MAG: phosphocholine cytidylyltransferase family protein [Thermoleophilia bacterium]|nr:phosphocholine cytidylyltransferase family protein [Thermoleophilia bacterium]